MNNLLKSLQREKIAFILSWKINWKSLYESGDIRVNIFYQHFFYVKKVHPFWKIFCCERIQFTQPVQFSFAVPHCFILIALKFKNWNYRNTKKSWYSLLYITPYVHFESVYRRFFRLLFFHCFVCFFSTSDKNMCAWQTSPIRYGN